MAVPFSVYRSDELTRVEQTFQYHTKHLVTGNTASVEAVEGIIVTAGERQAEWARLRLRAFFELGKFLLRTPYRGRGRPKLSAVDNLPSFADLGIRDRRIACRAIRIARIPQIYSLSECR